MQGLNSGKSRLIDMTWRDRGDLPFFSHCSLSSKTLLVRSFSIHSVLSFLTTIVVVFLSMERERPRDEEGLG